MLKLTGTAKSYIWGGNKLKSLYGKAADGTLAESWEVSVHPDGPSFTADGTLADYIRANPASVDKSGSPFPVLIKYIDAADDLSVQVHPDEIYARTHENDGGKTEMWYVIDADEGAGIYCGFKESTTREAFLEKVKDGTVKELLNFIPVKKGDCFLIKAGTVHSIKKGCVVCEVQQSSNVTYRVFDYNRVGADGKPRQLHVDKAAEVINYDKYKNETNSGEYALFKGGKMRLLTDCGHFCCRELVLDGAYTEENGQSFTAVNVIEGGGKINGAPFNAGDSFFVGCGEKLTLEGNAVILLTSQPERSYCAGVDLGGTFIKCGIVDNLGRIVAKSKIPTPETDLEKMASKMCGLIRSLEESAGVKVSAVGVGAPGIIDGGKGVIVYSNNISWSNVPLCAALKDKLDLPVFMTNDANAAALGEYSVLGGRYKNVIFVTIGTGVGGGIIIDGKLYEGKDGAGAEIGHHVIIMGGERCTCGRRGCLEAYASATGLINRTKAAMLNDKDSLLWSVCPDINTVNGETAFAALKLGDKTAKEVVDGYIENLAAGITNLANIFRPDVILMGGGVSAAGDALIKPLCDKVNAEIFGGSSCAPVRIERARLGNDAGLIGAAMLADSRTRGAFKAG